MNQVVSPYLPEVQISETKSGMIIRLNDEPKVFCRPYTNDDVSQDRSMMFFQQLVMKEGRAALRAKSLGVFRNDLAIEIEIVSLQPPQSMKLEKVLKAIFDGLNIHVIDNDYLVSNAQIWLQEGKKRSPKTIIKVHIEDLVTHDSIDFSCELPCIEKHNPVVYNIGAVMTQHPKSAANMKMIEQTFMSQPYTINKQYEICHMLFYTSDRSKDVDNMFLAYIDVIRKQGFLDSSNNIGIGMYKRHVDKKDERAIINLVAK